MGAAGGRGRSPSPVIVLGGGSTGENAASYARDNGLSAAVVENELVGGRCSYWACMPSKALLRPGEALAAARRVPAAADAVTGSVDVDRALDTRDAFANGWDDGPQADWLAGAGVDLVRGHARLTGARTVEVTTPDQAPVELTARRAVVVATGTRAALPPVDGLDEITVWDNRDVTSAKQVPRRLLVLGGGVVDTEMARVYHWLGATSAGGHESDTDDRLRVNDVENSWLYAVGDVNGRALLTHQGKYQARLVGVIIAGHDREAWADHAAVPRVSFTDPQVAAVGRTEQQARDAGVEVRTVRYDIGSTAAGALAGKGVHGTAQLGIDTDRRVIVGATFVGPGVGELLHAATIAIVGTVSLDILWHAVPAFPTLSEIWLRLLEAERAAS